MLVLQLEYIVVRTFSYHSQLEYLPFLNKFSRHITNSIHLLISPKTASTRRNKSYDALLETVISYR